MKVPKFAIADALAFVILVAIATCLMVGIVGLSAAAWHGVNLLVG